MKKQTRREFLGTAVMGTVASSFLAGCAENQQAEAPMVEGPQPFARPISFQSYGMRRQIEEDFPGTLASVQQLGYAGVEMCSPRSYGQAGFGNLTPLPPEEIKQMIDDSGLFCRTCHFQSREVIGDDLETTAGLAEASAEYAAALGLADIVMSGSGIGNDGTVEDFERWGEKANRAGEVIRAAGLRLGYHNHAIGPEMEDGRLQYDVIMEVLDPALVTMQFQLASISGGYDIVEYLNKYAGRYSSLHMHDWDPEAPGRGDRMGSVVPCGEGIIDWPALLEASMKSPVTDHGFIVEIETEEPFEGLRRSIEFLRTVEV